jgi:hypothetical protein
MCVHPARQRARRAGQAGAAGANGGQQCRRRRKWRAAAKRQCAQGRAAARGTSWPPRFLPTLSFAWVPRRRWRSRGAFAPWKGQRRNEQSERVSGCGRRAPAAGRNVPDRAATAAPLSPSSPPSSLSWTSSSSCAPPRHARPRRAAFGTRTRFGAVRHRAAVRRPHRVGDRQQLGLDPRQLLNLHSGLYRRPRLRELRRQPWAPGLGRRLE